MYAYACGFDTSEYVELDIYNVKSKCGLHLNSDKFIRVPSADVPPQPTQSYDLLYLI